MPVEQLTRFYKAIQDDSRLSPAHISLYITLFQGWNEQDFQNPVPVVRRQIMHRAKISGLATYHRCMRELHSYGYISYQPPYNPAKGSLAFFKC